MRYNFLFLLLLLLASCYEEASIQVTNKVHNVRMDKIQLGEIGIGSELMPGESTKKLTISEFTEDITFPITAPLQFYMVKGENTVFLKTKNSYTLYADDELQIIISDSTEVVNSATE